MLSLPFSALSLYNSILATAALCSKIPGTPPLTSELIVFSVVKTDLSAQLGPACALGLLVALGQCSVAGAESLAGSVVYLHGDALCSPLLGETLHMAGLPVAQEVLEPGKKLREFPVEMR